MSPSMNKALAVVIVGLAVFALYAQKLNNPFVWDDHAFVLNAPEHDRVENIPGFFTTAQHRLYRPLRSVVYTLARHFWGMNPAVHHAIGMTYHILIAMIFTIIVLLLSGNLRVAFFAGMIAGLHPVLCDRTVSVTGSFDLLGMMFAYGAVAAFIAWLQKKNARWLAASMVLLALGLLASEEAVTAPLLMVLVFLTLPESQENKKRFAWGIGIAFSLLFAYLAVRSQMIPGFARVNQHAAGGVYETLLTMSVVFWRYLGLALFPHSLAPAHSVTIHSQLSLVSVAAILGLVALVVAAFALRKKKPLVFVAVGWFFIGLAPFSNLIPLDTLYAERYFYSGMKGFAIVAALVLAYLMDNAKGARKVFALALIGTVFGFCFFLSAQRIEIWKSDRTLWADALQNDPDTYLANLNWAGVLLKEGDLQGNYQYLDRAVQLDPNRPEVFVGFGNFYMKMSDPAEAAEQYRHALRIQQGHLPAIEGLMQAELDAGNTNEAYRLALELLESFPNNLVSLNVVGYILAGSGHCQQALPILRRLVLLARDEDTAAAAGANLKHCENQFRTENE